MTVKGLCRIFVSHSHKTHAALKSNIHARFRFVGASQESEVRTGENNVFVAENYRVCPNLNTLLKLDGLLGNTDCRIVGLMDIRFISSLTPEDENAFAPALLKAVESGDWRSAGRAVVAVLNPHVAHSRRLPESAPWAAEAQEWLDALLSASRHGS